jgi:hypothetical protein
LRVRVAPILVSIRDQCLRVGDDGIAALIASLGLSAAPSGVEVPIEPGRFRDALLQVGFKLSREDAGVLNETFCDTRGYFRSRCFLHRLGFVLWGPRRAWTLRTFAALSQGRPSVSGAQLQAHFTPSTYAPVVEGTVTATTVEADFAAWISQAGPAVTESYFCAYYAGVSANCGENSAADDRFAVLLASAWGLDPSTFSTDEYAEDTFDYSAQAAAPTVKTSAARQTREVHFGSFFYAGTIAHAIPEGFVSRRQAAAAAAAAAGPASEAPSRSYQAPPRETVPVGRCIVGYTGHVPFAAERFGESHLATVMTTPDLTRIRQSELLQSKVEAAQQEAAARPPLTLFVRSGNKANRHNFALA